MKKHCLVVWGGWDGHEPEKVANIYKKILESNNYEVEVSDTLDAFLDEEKLKTLHLIAPVWTMGEIKNEQLASVLNAVAGGTGIAGCHGGMCDSFRNSVRWQFMTGGQWVSHPGGDGVEFTVNIKNSSSPIVEGLKDFQVKTEHYYLHVDPCVEVLATTRFPLVNWYHSSNRACDMPVIWTKHWGYGRVFYNSLGHHADVFDVPEAYKLMEGGLLWAATGKDIAIKNNYNADDFKSDAKMF